MKREIIKQIILQISKKGELSNINKIKATQKAIRLEPRILSNQQRLNRGVIHL